MLLLNEGCAVSILCLLVIVRCFDDNLYTRNYKIGIDYIQKDQYELGIKYLDLALKVNENSLECAQLLGTLYYKQGKVEESLYHLRYALKLEESLPSYSATIAANFVEILRATGDAEGARKLAYARLNHFKSTRDTTPVSVEWVTVYFNLAIVEAELDHMNEAISLYREVISLFPSDLQTYRQFGSFLVERGFYIEAEVFLKRAVTLFPNSHQIYFLLGGAIHNQKRFEEALHYYYEADRIEPQYYSAKSNIGAALQSLGRAPEAQRYYEAAIPYMMNDPGILNNYGALLGTMNRKDEEVYWLEKAIALDPAMEHALTNLAGYYQDEGLLDKAADYLHRAAKVSRTSATLMKLRSATMLSPICTTWAQMVAERVGMRRQVEELLQNYSLPGRAPVKVELDTSLDRIHFYIQYHGLNDRHLQELIAQAYLVHMDYNINYFNPFLLTSRGEANQKEDYRKARVGFLSKFFGVFEPHGLLLDGVMKYLPRTHFEVIALPVARTDGKSLSPGILDSADVVQEISLDTTHALEAISKLNLDILVFADVLSEPMNHFLAHSRLAKTQIAFWGNPITSGSSSMDYFISADIMEHPHRTRMHISDEPYTEQVVLTEGQGIWYFKPESPEVELKKANMDKLVSPFKNYTRSSFALQDDWFIFLLPQSVFKIHPLYDTVIAQILIYHENIHLMVTGGRRQRWTDIYKERLHKSIIDADKTGNALNRFHVIERVSSEKFNSLLSLADVILHPFPFDGSKTSADALNAGKPLITLPAEYLRGRMGVAFLRTMNIPDLVARNVTEYIQIAIRLFEDYSFYGQVQRLIIERVELIWEDMEVPFAWSKFLEYIMKSQNSHAFDGSITWDSFITQTGRNSDRDTELRNIRTRNQQIFDAQWGREEYLLVRGVAEMESYIYNSSIAPRIFTNWRRETDHPDYESSLSKKSIQPSAVDEDHNGSADDTVTRKNEMKKGAPIGSESENAFTNEFRGKILTGQFEEAVALGLGALEGRLLHDAQFLLELGIAEYFRGDYSSAFNFCSIAHDLAPRSTLINGCLGVSGLYLSDKQNQTIRALLDAWLLLGGHSSLLAELSREYHSAANEHGSSTNDGPEIRSSLFAITRSSVEHSLVQGLGTFQRYEECIQLSFELLGLPDISHGGAYILAFSVVDWSDERSEDVSRFGQQLQDNNQLMLDGNIDFLTAIRQVQTKSDHILNPLLGCLMSLPPAYNIAIVLQQLMSVISLGENINAVSFMSSVYTLATGKSSSNSEENSNNAEQQPTYNTNGLVLLLQYFTPSNTARIRQSDLDTALAKNLANPAISEVYFLNEKEFEFSAFPNSFKIRQYVISKRLTFKDAFIFANTYLANRTVILANADIYFDQTLLRLGDPQRLDMRSKVLTMLKWVDRGADELSMSLRTDSQDAWIFQPPLNVEMAKKADFAMGLPRCDNRIAFLFEEANYSVVNPVFSIRAIEIDTSTRAHSLYEIGKAVAGDGKNVLLSDKFIF